MIRRRLIALAVTALSVLAAPAASAEPVTLKVNYSAIPPHLIPAIFMKKDLLKHEGKSYNIKFVFTRGSAIVMQTLAANEMDLGVLSSIAFVHGIQNAHLPFRAIGDLVQDGPQFTSRFAVKKDSSIKTVEDLKGHSIAVNGFGGALDMAARLMLKKHGLIPGKDVTIVEAKFPAMHAMVTSGKVDAAVFIAPFWYPAEKAGDLRALFTMKESLGDSEFLFWVATEQTLKKNHAALVDFFEDYIRARRWFLDPKNRAEALELMSKAAKRPVSNFEWALGEGGYYRTKDLRLDKKVFQNTIDQIYEAGFIKEKFDASPYIDKSIIIEAAARLK